MTKVRYLAIALRGRGRETSDIRRGNSAERSSDKTAECHGERPKASFRFTELRRFQVIAARWRAVDILDICSVFMQPHADLVFFLATFLQGILAKWENNDCPETVGSCGGPEHAHTHTHTEEASISREYYYEAFKPPLSSISMQPFFLCGYKRKQANKKFLQHQQDCAGFFPPTTLASVEPCLFHFKVWSTAPSDRLEQCTIGCTRFQDLSMFRAKNK